MAHASHLQKIHQNWHATFPNFSWHSYSTLFTLNQLLQYRHRYTFRLCRRPIVYRPQSRDHLECCWQYLALQQTTSPARLYNSHNAKYRYAWWLPDTKHPAPKLFDLAWPAEPIFPRIMQACHCRFCLLYTSRIFIAMFQNQEFHSWPMAVEKNKLILYE